MDVIYPQLRRSPRATDVAHSEGLPEGESAETFEKFALRGTPSTILVDRKSVSFGRTDHLDGNRNILAED